MCEMSKKSCIIYDSWGELLANLPDEMAGQLIKQIIAYAFDMTQPPIDNPAIGAMYAMIKAKIDEDRIEYEKEIKRRSEAGKKGMTNRWNNRTITEDNTVITDDNSVKQEITNITDSVSVSVSDSVSDKDIKKEKEEKKKFVKPSVSEVKAYCQERNNGVNPEAFIDFYESKGWKVGNQPMKDWKAAVRTWEKRDNRGSPPKLDNEIPKAVFDKIHDYPERKVDYAALEIETFGRRL